MALWPLEGKTDRNFRDADLASDGDEGLQLISKYRGRQMELGLL